MPFLLNQSLFTLTILVHIEAWNSGPFSVVKWSSNSTFPKLNKIFILWKSAFYLRVWCLLRSKRCGNVVYPCCSCFFCYFLFQNLLFYHLFLSVFSIRRSKVSSIGGIGSKTREHHVVIFCVDHFVIWDFRDKTFFCECAISCLFPMIRKSS